MATLGYPERGGYGEQLVMGGQVMCEVEKWIMTELMFVDDNQITFEKVVSFVVEAGRSRRVHQCSGQSLTG